MKQSFSLWILQCAIVILTVLLTASEGSSQSLQYVQGIVIETSYRPQMPYTVKAVYGDFVNSNPMYVQLWKETGKDYQYELVWQTTIQPSNDNTDGLGQWIILPESERIAMKTEYRLGFMNDVIPGPIIQPTIQQSGIRTEIILTDIKTVVENLTPGDIYDFDDLVFPYHMPLYLCNRTDCKDVRISLQRLTNAATVIGGQTAPRITESAANITFQMTMSPVVTTEPPVLPVVSEDDLFNKNTIIGILLGLGLLTLILLIVVCVLIGICLAIDRKKQREERYSAHVISTGSLNGVNEGFENYPCDTSDTSAKRLVTRSLPEQTIMVY